jgi:hypothetical protein
MIDAIKMTQQLVALELVDEGVTAEHILDRLVKRRRVETLRMSAFKSVRVILVYETRLPLPLGKCSDSQTGIT